MCVTLCDIALVCSGPLECDITQMCNSTCQAEGASTGKTHAWVGLVLLISMIMMLNMIRNTLDMHTPVSVCMCVCALNTKLHNYLQQSSS